MYIGTGLTAQSLLKHYATGLVFYNQAGDLHFSSVGERTIDTSRVKRQKSVFALLHTPMS